MHQTRHKRQSTLLFSIGSIQRCTHLLAAATVPVSSAVSPGLRSPACSLLCLTMWGWVAAGDHSSKQRGNILIFHQCERTPTDYMICLDTYQAVSMYECAVSVCMDPRLYLRLWGVVGVVSIVVFTWHSGLYAGRVEEVAQLLLLALSQAVNDATRLLLLLQAHMGIQYVVGVWYSSVWRRISCACMNHSPKTGSQHVFTRWVYVFSVKTLTARMRFRHFLSHMRIVCLATSSSMVYSNCSLANSSSSWRDFLMSTERYDSMLCDKPNTFMKSWLKWQVTAVLDTNKLSAWSVCGGSMVTWAHHGKSHPLRCAVAPSHSTCV